jgi:hypothetical protein
MQSAHQSGTAVAPLSAFCQLTRELTMTSHKPGTNEDDASRDPAEQSPTDIAVSKPIGDAIPTPVEPGLDQPLPEKGATPDGDEPQGSRRSTADDATPIGETDAPKGVPEPGPSDFA